MKLTFGYPEGNVFLTTEPNSLAELFTGVKASKLDSFASSFGLKRDPSEVRPRRKPIAARRARKSKAQPDQGRVEER